MLQRALRGKGRVAYCSSPAASEPRPVVLPASRQVRPRQRDEVRRPVSIAATFEIEYLQYLDAEGKLVRDDVPAFARDVNQLVELYKLMLFVRVFDGKAVALQRTGKLGTYASCLGHEAAHVAIGTAMQEDDVFAADVSRIRRAVLPRRETARSALVLGRRRARQRFLRARARLRLVACRSRRRPCTRPARRSRSRSARSRASPSPSSATAARRRAISTLRSTWPAR